MKKKELLLLTYFRKNSRSSLTELSKKTKMPVSTIFDRLKIYQQGIIKKHTSIIDFSKLGYLAKANVMLQIAAEKRQETRSFLEKHENVNSLYKVNNGYDFLVELIFKDMKELENFLEQLEVKYPIKQKVVYYIVEDIAREKFMTDENLVKIQA